MTEAIARDVVLGKNSAVWRLLADDHRISERFIAIGHTDLDSFSFLPGDRIWILSYSRDLQANKAMFDRLAQATDISVIYVSTATANVNRVTNCYRYPRIKLQCEELSRTMLGAQILTIGVVYRDLKELAGGTTMATSVDQIATFMANPQFSEAVDEPTLVFSPMSRPFSNFLERAVFAGYGKLQRFVGWPCLLRPLDVILRALGWRWYGYLYLSNRLWLTTTS